MILNAIIHEADNFYIGGEKQEDKRRKEDLGREVWFEWCFLALK